MNLFKSLAGILNVDSDMTIVVRKTSSGNLVVSTSVKNNAVSDTAKDIIAPFVVSGTPDELDAEFVGTITAPMEQSVGLQTSMQNFEASKKAAQAKSQAATEAKKKEADEKSKALKEANANVEKAKKLEAEHKYKEAVKLYEAALPNVLASEKPKIQTAIDRCKKKDQPDIFSSAFDFDAAPAAEETKEAEEEPAAEEAAEEPTEETEEPEESEETEEGASDDTNPLNFGEE